MKNKTKTNLTIATVAVAIVSALLWIGTSCQKSVKDSDEKNNVSRTYNGNRVYEIEHKGSTYLVIETHRGIGICQKSGEVVWTKEVSDPPCTR